MALVHVHASLNHSHPQYFKSMADLTEMCVCDSVFANTALIFLSFYKKELLRSMYKHLQALYL